VTPAVAFVALGGNIGDRLGTLRSALTQLAGTQGCELLDVSCVYETTPVGPSNDPFLNAAARLHTALDPVSMLERLHAVERDHGRQRRIRWDARTLDLDLLLYFEPGADAPMQSDAPHCRLPHPAMLQRDFVLAPLVDLAPDLVLRGKSLAAHLSAIPEDARTVMRRIPVDPPLLQR